MATKTMITTKRIVFGGDPEFFFTVKGKTIGAEKVLPKEGLEYIPKNDNNEEGGRTAKGNNSKIIIDGIQAELNPRANTCRANFGNEISNCFKTIKKQIEKNPEITASFEQTVEITKEEMKSLDKQNKKFGCTPSFNAYNKAPGIKIKDASRYYKRSAGGHLHLGHNDDRELKKTLENTKELIPLMDIIVGNTCVLFDRNPGNIERRKNYGRAGEFRTPPHGLEYRTLSNFWLKSYQLMGMVTGLARLAIGILADSTEKDNYAKEIRSRVNLRKIRQAINNNDFNLAYKNFKAIEEYLLKIIPTSGDHPLHKGIAKEFNYVIEKGIDHFFKEDPMTHWVNLPEGHETGWETFLEKTVRSEMIKENAT